ncbi:MAG: aspartate-alanine antiporter [Candidatus Omnitrophota bacterium]|jgi:putative transport protein
MIQEAVSICREYPQVLVFFALAAGHFIGKIKFRGFSLGSTAGTLLTALVIGQMDVDVPAMAKAIGFALFIFCIGYRVGPQFFGALKKEGLHYVMIAVFFAVIGLLTAVVLGKTFKFDGGTTAGIIGGALTQSSVIGTADGAIKHLAIPAAQKAAMEGNVAIAYAITYIFGVAGLIVFFKLVPRIMKINLKEEAIKLEKEMSGTEEELKPELFSWYQRLGLRAYRVTNADIWGKTVSEVESLFPEEVAIEKLKRGDEVIDPEPGMTVLSGDVLALAGPRRDFLKMTEMIGPEIDDRSVTDLIGEIIKICVLNKEAVGKTLGRISSEKGHGCFLRKLVRQGHEIPLTRDLAIHKCDVLQVTGSQKDIERLVKYLGYPERSTDATDLLMVGGGCVLGTLLGILAVPVFGIPLTLGVGGGVLVSGLIFGWLRSLHPTFGQIPVGAQWIFTTFGLNLFIACVGLQAGPEAVHALRTNGAQIFAAGAILTLTPHILSLLFGHFVLKLNPVLLFGALTGAGTATPSLNALKEEAESHMPALGYTVPFALGNFILTVWGTIIVHLV